MCLGKLCRANRNPRRSWLRWLSDDAVVISYTRLTQRLSNGDAITHRCCETRIWQRRKEQWQQVHVHRS